MTVRVRFAPSPTGYLHIGGVRTALFNWMFARKHGGQFILRIEDTDRSRFVEGSVEYITDSLRWLGIDWDEGPDVGGEYGPYTQSERLELYVEWANWLLDNGHAYKDYTSSEELAEMRAYQRENKLPIGYDGRHRELSAEQQAAFEAEGRKPVIRFKAPKEGQIVVNDQIRGDITVDCIQVQDNVLLKSDGFPTYHLANVVDDHYMKITHIMRGDEWISTAPLHALLYKAFGWEMPTIAHMPVIMSPSGKGKLSKRDQAFEDGGYQVLVKLLDYRDAGYLPVAVDNWLANVGWSYGDDVEIFNIEDAIPRFTLPAINPAPAKLPFSKLEWLNNQHIQTMDDVELAKLIKPYLDAAGVEIPVDALILLIPALKPRLKRLPDAVDFLAFLDDDAWNPDEDRMTHKKMGVVAAKQAFEETLAYVSAETYTLETLSEKLTAIGESAAENGKAGPYLGTLRYAITGQKVSPPLYESIMALGTARTVERLTKIITTVSEAAIH